MNVLLRECRHSPARQQVDDLCLGLAGEDPCAPPVLVMDCHTTTRTGSLLGWYLLNGGKASTLAAFAAGCFVGAGAPK